MSFKILDCTLRDGGYYTNWDFPPELVKNYIRALNALPIDYLEIGYRSAPDNDYRGEFFYCPEFVLHSLRLETEKKIAVMLNEKDVRAEFAAELMAPCIDCVDMVRLAVDPVNVRRALGLAEVLKKLGFEVAVNLMYMSTWKEREGISAYFPEIGAVANYICMVDSFGSVYPDELKDIYSMISAETNSKIGFHGHNNQELALINSLTAIDCGASMVDGTFTGMGRGAGNLKTELLLTSLNGRSGLEVDFNSLSAVVDEFSVLQQEHKWGTNLPYMVSGANSLPQKDVMNWIAKRFLPLSSIVRALANRSQGIEDNVKLGLFEPGHTSSNVLLVGGGDLVKQHEKAIYSFLAERPGTTIIHASSRNSLVFTDLPNPQIHCLSGNEGQRLEATFEGTEMGGRDVVLAPYPRPMGTYLPAAFRASAFELREIRFTEKYKDSVTATVLQTALDLGATDVKVVGYDGYSGDISKQQMELFKENDRLFQQFFDYSNIKLQSLTQSDYATLEAISVYASL